MVGAELKQRLRYGQHFLHALVHDTDIARVRKGLDVAAQVQPVVVCALACKPFGVVARYSEGN